MKRQRQLFAVVRVDESVDPSREPGNKITIKEVVATQAEAEAEVARLNRLNADKGCVYFWQATRMVGNFSKAS